MRAIPSLDRHHLHTLVGLYQPAIPETPQVSTEGLAPALALFPSSRTAPSLDGIVLGDFVARGFSTKRWAGRPPCRSRLRPTGCADGSLPGGHGPGDRPRRGRGPRALEAVAARSLVSCGDRPRAAAPARATRPGRETSLRAWTARRADRPVRRASSPAWPSVSTRRRAGRGRWTARPRGGWPPRGRGPARPASVGQLVLDDEGVDVGALLHPVARRLDAARFEHTERAVHPPPHPVTRCDDRIHQQHERRPPTAVSRLILPPVSKRSPTGGPRVPCLLDSAPTLNHGTGSRKRPRQNFRARVRLVFRNATRGRWRARL